MDKGKSLMQALAEVSTFSESDIGVTRCFLTKEHRQLLVWLENFAKQHQLNFSIDDSGNGRIIKTALESETYNKPISTLLFGSHQDTVKQGGRYDGILGVLLPLMVMKDLPALPFHVECIAFGDEEGTRFQSTLVGSSAVSGCFDKAMLARCDENGVSMEEAMKQFNLNPNNISQLTLDPSRLLGFIEVHIEQGPILENKNLPVGLVSAITGIERHSIKVSGKAGHAGTTPMHLRNDALVKASGIVQFVNDLCTSTDQLVGVVGKLSVTPNAVNVIPGSVELTVELRSPDYSVREKAQEQLHEFLAGLNGIEHECTYSQEGVECDSQLTSELSAAIKTLGIEPLTIFSGAGHDGLAISKVTPIAMLFVRCLDGLSHHPDESITSNDCDIAMEVIHQFILNKAQQYLSAN